MAMLHSGLIVGGDVKFEIGSSLSCRILRARWADPRSEPHEGGEGGLNRV